VRTAVAPAKIVPRDDQVFGSILMQSLTGHRIRSLQPRYFKCAAAHLIYLRVDPSEKLEAVEAVLPPGLRRGRFKAPDALIASLFDPG
jgi:hypothetical protein